jgi:hypothetical protein
LAHAGERDRKEPEGGEGEGSGELGWAKGGLGWLFLFPFFFLFLSYTQSFKPCHLNSIKFEFKPNTIKNNAPA